ELPGEIAGLCSVERRVSKTRAATVCCHEVLDRREAFLVRRDDGELDGLALRVLNKALHASHLGELTHGASSTGDHEVVHRAIRVHRIGDELFDLALCVVPDLDDHALSLFTREKTLV